MSSIIGGVIMTILGLSAVSLITLGVVVWTIIVQELFCFAQSEFWNLVHKTRDQDYPVGTWVRSRQDDRLFRVEAVERGEYGGTKYWLHLDGFYPATEVSHRPKPSWAFVETTPTEEELVKWTTRWLES